MGDWRERGGWLGMDMRVDCIGIMGFGDCAGWVIEWFGSDEWRRVKVNTDKISVLMGHGVVDFTCEQPTLVVESDNGSMRWNVNVWDSEREVCRNIQDWTHHVYAS